MCGRFTVRLPTPDLAAAFGVAARARETAPSFNVAPGREVPVVVDEGEGRRLDAFRWGLIPRWAKDPSIGERLINARAETVAEKPAFRQAFLHRRCLILADGFYEWKAEGTRKTPYFISVEGVPVFAFAGLWERWAPPDGEPVLSCAILTVEANAFMRSIHHRMPVILPPEAHGAWLDPHNGDRQALLALLRPFPSEGMRAHPVSTFVNAARHDSIQCVLPLE
ncbi:MAG: SOS response-associated peptidase [Acidobacteriota bacterium]